MQNKDTISANGIKWSDVDFQVDPSGIRMLINADSVKSSIRSILNTRIGERPMRRSLGAGIEDHVFDLMDEDLQDFFTVQIKKIVEAYDDRVQVLEIKYDTHPDNGSVTVVIYFAIPGYNQVFSYSQQVGG